MEECLSIGSINKFWEFEFGPSGIKSASKLVFCRFIEFGLYIFLRISFNDSLRQFLNLVDSKITKSNLERANFGPNGPQLSPNIGFFVIFSSLVY